MRGMVVLSFTYGQGNEEDLYDGGEPGEEVEEPHGGCRVGRERRVLEVHEEKERMRGVVVPKQ